MTPISLAIERLRFAVRELPKLLTAISEADSEQRPSPERWTKKEVVGHLIDSAANNHQRFVRGQLALGQDFLGYAQEQWVNVQNYQGARWRDLIELWRTYNTHLIHVAECMTDESRKMTCRINGGPEVTLAALFIDYVDHLEHHLRKMLGSWEGGLRWELRPSAAVTAAEQSALQTLSNAVYPPDQFANWPGRAIEWAKSQWSLIGRNTAGVAVCHVGLLLRQAEWNDRAVNVGGIGGVKTHPDHRGNGYAASAMRLAVAFFRDRGDVDFGLLVCEPDLIPYYERLGWRTFPGELFVTQLQARVPFTFNRSMTLPMRINDAMNGRIDLLGPPW